MAGWLGPCRAVTFDSHGMAAVIDDSCPASVAPRTMPVLAVRAAQRAFPTGNPNFAVMQPFPSAFKSIETGAHAMFALWKFTECNNSVRRLFGPGN